MTKKFNQYLGKAGHLAVMSEFLMLGWNVAIPEVDIGDDIFVVHDDNGTLRRVQVKSSMGTTRRIGFSGQFSVSIENLENTKSIFVHYVFIVRIDNLWTKPLIIRQDYLQGLVDSDNIGSKTGKNIIFYFSYLNNKVICSGVDLTKYVEDYSDFPKLIH